MIGPRMGEKVKIKKASTGSPRKAIVAIFFCLTLLIVTANYHIGAGENGNPQSPGKVTQPDDSAIKSNHPRWFADPERGWIRTEQQSDARKKQRSDAKDKDVNNRPPAGRVLWEY
jgi:hypothetical protein